MFQIRFVYRTCNRTNRAGGVGRTFARLLQATTGEAREHALPGGYNKFTLEASENLGSLYHGKQFEGQSIPNLARARGGG